MIFDMLPNGTGVIAPISHNISDLGPRPRFAHVKKASTILTLGWKKLEIQDSIKADGHVHGGAKSFSASANRL
jgi:hypothetical protein